MDRKSLEQKLVGVGVHPLAIMDTKVDGDKVTVLSLHEPSVRKAMEELGFTFVGSEPREWTPQLSVVTFSR